MPLGLVPVVTHCLVKLAWLANSAFILPPDFDMIVLNLFFYLFDFSGGP